MALPERCDVGTVTKDRSDDAEAGGATYPRWHAERITESALVLFSGEAHLDACDTHRPQVLADILRVWT